MNRRGRPLGIWKNRLREFNEREKGIGRGDGLEHVKGECLDREKTLLPFFFFFFLPLKIVAVVPVQKDIDRCLRY